MQENIETKVDTITKMEELQKQVRDYVAEGTDAKSEAVTEQVIPDVVPEVSEIEKKAREMGWRPESEYSGSNFVDAKEYVARAPFFERIERQSREIKELRDLVKQSTSHLTTIQKAGYDRAIADLEASKMHMVETGNVEDYRATEARVQSLKQQMQVDPIINTPTPAPERPKDIVDFEARNKDWYNDSTIENAKMMAAAQAMDTYLTNVARLEQGLARGVMPVIDPKKHLESIESEIKRTFPTRFQPAQKVVSSVGKSTTDSTASSQGSLVSRLTPSQKELGMKFHQSNKDYTLEMYAKDLDAIGRLSK